MQIKRYLADDMRQALKRIREEQGPNAVILSSQSLGTGLEVVAAVDYDESLLQPRPAGKTGEPAAVEPAPAGPAPGAGRTAPVSGPGTERRRGAGQGATASAPDQPTAGSEAAMASMRKEIKSLRRVLECQLASLAWNDFSRRSPVRADLLRNLMNLGLPPTLAQDLAARIPAQERDRRRAWRQALSDLSRLLRVDAGDPLARGGVLALVGPTGVGKTTAVARLARHYAHVHGPEQVAIVSADSSRPGAQESLFSWGRELNVPVYPAGSPAEVDERLARLGHLRIVLVDTAGVARDPWPAWHASGPAAPGGRALIRWLVLAANAQTQVLEEALMRYQTLPLAGIMATKLDETASLGGLLSVVAKSAMPLVRVSDSPELSRPLQTPGSRDLVKRAVTLLRASPPRPQGNEVLAQQVGELHRALG